MRTLLAFLLMVSIAQAEQVGDMNADGKVDTIESIISLQIAAGIQQSADLGQYIPATGNAAPSDVLQGKTFSNSSGNDLLGELVLARGLGCAPDSNTWMPDQCIFDCEHAIASHLSYNGDFIEDCDNLCSSIISLITNYYSLGPISSMLCAVPPET